MAFRSPSQGAASLALATLTWAVDPAWAIHTSEVGHTFAAATASMVSHTSRVAEVAMADHRAAEEACCSPWRVANRVAEVSHRLEPEASAIATTVGEAYRSRRTVAIAVAILAARRVTEARRAIEPEELKAEQVRVRRAMRLQSAA